MAITVASELAFGIDVPEQTRADSGGAAVSEEWLAVAELLAANVGQWAKIAETEKYPQASALSHRINTAASKAFAPAASYEAVARKAAPVNGNDEPSGAVYARYVGEAVDPVKELVSNHDLAALKQIAKDEGFATTGSKVKVAERIIQGRGEAQELVPNN